MSFPDGTLLQVTGTPAQFLVLDGFACALPDRQTEENLFTPQALEKFKQISLRELETVPPGLPLTSGASLIKGASEPPVYLHSWGVRCWIVSHEVFGEYGFDYQKIQVLPDNVLGQIPRGRDVT